MEGITQLDLYFKGNMTNKKLQKVLDGIKELAMENGLDVSFDTYSTRPVNS